jgi:hypothetical protein
VALGLTSLDLHNPVVKAADEWALQVELGKHDGPPIRLITTRHTAHKAFLAEYVRSLHEAATS